MGLYHFLKLNSDTQRWANFVVVVVFKAIHCTLDLKGQYHLVAIKLISEKKRAWKIILSMKIAIAFDYIYREIKMIRIPDLNNLLRLNRRHVYWDNVAPSTVERKHEFGWSHWHTSSIPPLDRSAHWPLLWLVERCHVPPIVGPAPYHVTRWRHVNITILPTSIAWGGKFNFNVVGDVSIGGAVVVVVVGGGGEGATSHPCEENGAYI